MLRWYLTRASSNPIVLYMSNTNYAAIESLRTFALTHNEADFAHTCTAALEGEAWAELRVMPIVRDPQYSSDATVLRPLRATDCTRPDGAVARSIEV